MNFNLASLWVEHKQITHFQWQQNISAKFSNLFPWLREHQISV